MATKAIESVLEQYDSAIDNMAQSLWYRHRFSEFDWEDIAQEVRLAVLTGKRYIHPDFPYRSIRQEAINAFFRLSDSLDPYHIEDDWALKNECEGDSWAGS